MSKCIIFIHIRIIVTKVLIARVIRRIDIDDIYPALMGIAEGGEGFQVVTLNEDMVRGIRLVAHYRLVLHFAQHRQRLAQPFFYVFWFVFPHQPILLMLTQQPDEAATLVVCQTLQGLQLADQFSFVDMPTHSRTRLRVRQRETDSCFRYFITGQFLVLNEFCF